MGLTEVGVTPGDIEPTWKLARGGCTIESRVSQRLSLRPEPVMGLTPPCAASLVLLSADIITITRPTTTRATGSPAYTLWSSPVLLRFKELSIYGQSSPLLAERSVGSSPSVPNPLAMPSIALVGRLTVAVQGESRETASLPPKPESI